MSKKIYLDYQATTPVSKEILEKMIPYFSDNFGNPHSNNHSYGRSASEAVEEARENIANLINSNKEEIIFTSGATESNNFAIKSNHYYEDRKLIRPADVTLQIPDCSKFVRATGWEPSISYEQTLQDMLDYWRSEVKYGRI